MRVFTRRNAWLRFIQGDYGRSLMALRRSLMTQDSGVRKPPARASHSSVDELENRQRNTRLRVLSDFQPQADVHRGNCIDGLAAG